MKKLLRRPSASSLRFSTNPYQVPRSACEAWPGRAGEIALPGHRAEPHPLPAIEAQFNTFAAAGRYGSIPMRTLFCCCGGAIEATRETGAIIQFGRGIR